MSPAPPPPTAAAAPNPTRPRGDSAPQPAAGQVEPREAQFRGTTLASQVQFLAARLRSVGHQHANQLLQQHLDLKVRHYSVLSLAASGIGPSQRELSDFLSLDPSQIVSLVDALESRGLVKRQVDSRDRRSRIVVATEDGKRVCAEAEQLTRASDDVVLRHLTRDERTELARLLGKVAF